MNGRRFVTEVRRPEDLGAPATAFVRCLLAAMNRDDPAEFRYQLDQAATTLGLGRGVDDVLFPAMREIGHRRQAGSCDAATERTAVESARAWLEALATVAPAPLAAPVVLLACGPRDAHSIGVEALAMLLRSARQACRLLGPNVSVRAMSVALQASRPSAVVVVSHLKSGHSGASDLLRCAYGAGAATFYAGASFDAEPYRRDVPGSYLGTHLTRACSVILESVPASSARSARSE